MTLAGTFQMLFVGEKRMDGFMTVKETAKMEPDRTVCSEDVCRRKDNRDSKIR